MAVVLRTLGSKAKEFFLKEQVPFSNSRDIHWSRVKHCFFGLIALITAVVLVAGSPKATDKFAESQPTRDPIEEPSEQRQVAIMEDERHPSYYVESPGRSYVTRFSTRAPVIKPSEAVESMIIKRSGTDPSTQIAAGIRFRAKLSERTIVGETAIPVIAVLTSDLESNGEVVASKGARLMGRLSLNADKESAEAAWSEIETLDGVRRPISAITMGVNGQPGIPGKLGSSAFKNTVGKTLSRFVSAYAEGSMDRGAFGSQSGGSENGYRNAVGETAKDIAEGYANDLKREVKWIEIDHKVEFTSILTEPFTFADPGGRF